MCNSNLKITLHYWNNEEITTLIVLLKSCNLWRGLLNTILCDTCTIFSDLIMAGWWFSPGIPVSSTNKTDHLITEILLKKP
jgi:hypothetical protein